MYVDTHTLLAKLEESTRPDNCRTFWYIRCFLLLIMYRRRNDSLTRSKSVRYSQRSS